MPMKERLAIQQQSLSHWNTSKVSNNRIGHLHKKKEKYCKKTQKSDI